jgi:hypothetical protein
MCGSARSRPSAANCFARPPCSASRRSSQIAGQRCDVRVRRRRSRRPPPPPPPGVAKRRRPVASVHHHPTAAAADICARRCCCCCCGSRRRVRHEDPPPAAPLPRRHSQARNAGAGLDAAIHTGQQSGAGAVTLPSSPDGPIPPFRQGTDTQQWRYIQPSSRRALAIAGWLGPYGD